MLAKAADGEGVMSETDQRAVLAFLETPQAYGPDAPDALGEVARIDTHISAVFLAGERAFKLKKAVKLPYLDFSTLAQRKAACEAEITINRRTAPDMYLGVASVVREPGGGLALGGAALGDPATDARGVIVDWLVVMRRFDPAATLDRLAERGELTSKIVTDLSDRLVRFYAAAQPVPAGGGKQGMASIIASNHAAFLSLPPGALPQADIARLKMQSDAALARLGALLDRRRDRGRVRHCHGDLHLRNIVMLRGVPTPFDAIEFSRDLANIDVMYDYAFLIMDLIERGFSDLAGAALQRILDLTGDYDGLPALALFLSVRAAVRAHVESQSALAQSTPSDAAQATRHAQHYLELSLRFLEPSQPRLLAIGGLSGTGKSTLARRIAARLAPPPGAIWLRSDVLRKQLFDTKLDARLAPDAYSDAATARVYGRMNDLARQLLAGGITVVVDAVFAKPAERDAIAQVAKDCAAKGHAFAGLWLDAPAEILERRVAARSHDVSDADVAVLRRQLCYRLGEIGWRQIDAGGRPGETLSGARAALSEFLAGEPCFGRAGGQA
jgi:aminoglycoside phosphotransferase family enzyme/gluconate kinase